MNSKRYLHIGSWNIEHFSKKGGRTENIYALSEHIQMASLDILALQEIYITHNDNGLKRNKELDGVIDLLMEQTSNTWAYEIHENRDASDTSQLCAIMWNDTIIEKLDTLRIPVATNVEGDSIWDRVPHATKFRYQGKSDLVILPVHMKSNYGGVTIAKRKRHKEAQALMAQLDFIKENLDDLDIVILGDTNCLGSYEKAIEVFTNHGFLDLNAADAGTFMDGKAPFDRIFVPENQREFIYSRQYILVSANPNDHDKYLSDHFLVKTVMKLLKDDD